MSAHKQRVVKNCSVCRKPAIWKVFNTFNEVCGYFCNEHANAKVKELDKDHEELHSIRKRAEEMNG